MRELLKLPLRTMGCALCCFITTSCLIEAPDELDPPEQVPPRALVAQAVPSVLTPVQTSNQMAERPTFRVPFVSEDLGEKVLGRIFLNYGHESTERYLGGAERVGGSLDDTEREIEVLWDKNRTIDSGCYSVTLTIAHSSNYSLESLRPIDSTKTAFVTWWIVHGDIAPQSVNLDECFPATTPQ